jgi:hypothetical protein
MIFFRNFAGKSMSKGGKVMRTIGCIHTIAFQGWGNADRNEMNESVKVGRIGVNVTEIDAKVVIGRFGCGMVLLLAVLKQLPFVDVVSSKTS